MSPQHDTFDAARCALLDFDRATAPLAKRADAPQPPDPAVVHVLDAAGAVEAVMEADWNGRRSWRIRAVTPAGREVARLVADEQVWQRLKRDLLKVGDPIALLVKGYKDTVQMRGLEKA